MNDSLREFVRTGSSVAFGRVVRAHTDAVYSQSLRQLRDPGLAEEVTQIVFVALARKAGRISGDVILAGWLFNTTRNCCATMRRADLRRQKHEKDAMIFRAQQSGSDSRNEIHEDAESLLNDAIEKLHGRDRDAILLRYFQGQSLREVGMAMGVSENAAKQRVSRAIEKMRGWFAGQGLTVPSGMIAASLETAVKPAPAHLAMKLAAVPIAKPAAAMWGILGSKVAAAIVLGTVTIAAATLGVKAIARGGNAPVVIVDDNVPATAAATNGDQATPLDTLRKLSAALRRDDHPAEDGCLTDDGTDAQTAALVRSAFHFDGATRRLLAAMQKAFGHELQLEGFGQITMFPALGGGFEAMFDKMLEKKTDLPEVKIDGDSAQVRVNVAKELFAGPAQTQKPFLEHWSGATLFFRKVDGDWKLDTSRSLNIVTFAIMGNKSADPGKVIQVNEMSAEVMGEGAAQIESGQLGTPAAASGGIERLLGGVVKANRVNMLVEPVLPVVGG